MMNDLHVQPEIKGKVLPTVNVGRVYHLKAEINGGLCGFGEHT